MKELISAAPRLVVIYGEQVVKIGGQDRHDATDAMIITQGTATIEEASHFLSLVTRTDKPMVMVGSMRPTTAISADGSSNLYNGVSTAISPGARGCGVVTVLNDQIDCTHAGMTAYLIDAAVKPGAKGLVIAGVGDGHMTQAASIGRWRPAGRAWWWCAARACRPASSTATTR
jgi:L-asparaginase/Glu-tRNA(Gln) amidotransferase subunit D